MSDAIQAPTTGPVADHASLLYGSPEPAPGPGPSPASPPQAELRPDPEPDAPESEPDAPPAAASGNEPSAEEEGISSLADLAAFIESKLDDGQKLGDDWYADIKVPVKVNGAAGEATLGDIVDGKWINAVKIPVKVHDGTGSVTIKELVDGFQMHRAADQRLEEAKARTQAAEEQVVAATELIKAAESKLNDDAAAINWKQLRDSDPAEYVAKKDEIRERRAEIEALKRTAVETWRKGQEAKSAEIMEAMKQRMQAEHAALLDVPEFADWRDPDKAKAGKTRLAEYLTANGFTIEEVKAATDHRLVVMAEKARRYDESHARVDATKKKIVKVPKVIKPGGKRPDTPKPQAKDAASVLYG